MNVDDHETSVEEQRFQIPARDGYLLGATLYQPTGYAAAKEVLVFNAGGGLAIARYHHFLRFVAGEGFPVLAYDYRGVGTSRPERMRGFVAGLEDWAEYDQAGAIDSMQARFPKARVASVSHSIGCLVACTAPNARELNQMVLIAPHTGYWRDYGTAWKWPLALFWHVAMPILSRGVGYFPGRRLGVGDDFPLRFALQWAGRTSPQFAVESTQAKHSREAALLGHARELTVPGLAIRISDDAFATDNGVRRLLFAIPRAPVVRNDVDATAEGRRGVGHLGFFRRRHRELWTIVTRFLAPAQAPTPTLGRWSPQS